MNLFELNSNDVLSGYYDPEKDELNSRIPTDTRKPRLFLSDLNRLKRMRALRKLEMLKRETLLGVMYAEPEADAGGMGGPPGF